MLCSLILSTVLSNSLIPVLFYLLFCLPFFCPLPVFNGKLKPFKATDIAPSKRGNGCKSLINSCTFFDGQKQKEKKNPLAPVHSRRTPNVNPSCGQGWNVIYILQTCKKWKKQTSHTLTLFMRLDLTWSRSSFHPSICYCFYYFSFSKISF